MKLSDNKAAVLLSAGIGGLAFLMYVLGKASGRVEAYNECGDMVGAVVEVLEQAMEEAEA